MHIQPMPVCEMMAGKESPASYDSHIWRKAAVFVSVVTQSSMNKARVVGPCARRRDPKEGCAKVIITVNQFLARV